jgi:hypothetical protein
MLELLTQRFIRGNGGKGGSEGGSGRWEKGGEMTQTICAHKIKMKFKKRMC